MDKVRLYKILKVSVRFAQYITQLYLKFHFIYVPWTISLFFSSAFPLENAINFHFSLGKHPLEKYIQFED